MPTAHRSGNAFVPEKFEGWLGEKVANLEGGDVLALAEPDESPPRPVDEEDSVTCVGETDEVAGRLEHAGQAGALGLEGCLVLQLDRDAAASGRFKDRKSTRLNSSH